MCEARREIFYWLKRPTIAKVKAVLLWAHERAMKTEVHRSDKAKGVRRHRCDTPLEEVVRHVNGKARTYFRVILRRDRNWFLILTDNLHIKDMLEIGIRGVEIDGEEYFAFSYLRKEMLKEIQRTFSLKET